MTNDLWQLLERMTEQELEMPFADFIGLENDD